MLNFSTGGCVSSATKLCFRYLIPQLKYILDDGLNTAIFFLALFTMMQLRFTKHSFIYEMLV
jgi:hypothetical protein